MMEPNAQRTVVVTGGTKGIGLDIVRGFLELGDQVFAAARSEVEEFSKLAPGAVFVPADVRCKSDVDALIERAAQESGRVDVMVNNAGISIWRKLEGIDEAFADLLLETNLNGALWGCQAAAAKMPKGGVIINVASLAGKRGSANNSVYCASKFGMVGLTQALAKELGPRQIRVNGVCPVYVNTEALLSNLSGDHPEVGDADPQVFLEAWGAKSAALQRLPTGGECADLCVYLASDAARAITGQNINVDCGVLPQ